MGEFEVATGVDDAEFVLLWDYADIPEAGATTLIRLVIDEFLPNLLSTRATIASWLSRRF